MACMSHVSLSNKGLVVIYIIFVLSFWVSAIVFVERKRERKRDTHKERGGG